LALLGFASDSVWMQRRRNEFGVAATASRQTDV
jgi:hypothetical protein